MLSVFLVFFNSYAQCEQEETIVICDMTTIDFNNDSSPDGIINLYDEYNNIPGVTPINSSNGYWFDPNYYYALDESNGNLHLWDLPNSSETNTTYHFQLIDDNSGCPNGVVIDLNVVLGPFSGFAVPTIGENDVNIEMCDFSENCPTEAFVDLFQALLSTPSPHANGVWTYNGSSPNFLRIEDGRFLYVDIPYQPGPPLVDDEIFELTYSVPGISPCTTLAETTVKISFIRGVFAGAKGDLGLANVVNICEDDLLNGLYDNDINLLDDTYLVGEDIEGKWLFEQDPTGQLENFGDSYVNLKQIYDDLVASNPRFGCQNYDFTYRVESRPSICSSDESTVRINFFEKLRPFQQDENIEICIGTNMLSSINLYEYLSFTEENGVLYDYPNPEFTDWQLISGPSNLGLVSNGDESGQYTTLGTIDISNLTNADAGTYVFKYIVYNEYNCTMISDGVSSNCAQTFLPPTGCAVTSDCDHPCANSVSAQVVVTIYPKNYPGEDTLNLELCESDISNPLNLFSLLETNGIDAIYQGNDAYWLNVDTNETITNPFVLPDINGSESFNLEYHITANNCDEQAKLSFTVYQQYQAGNDTTFNVCIEDNSFELFSILNGTPDDNGTWTGPNGFTSNTNLVTFDPVNFSSGDYVYTVPSNGTCEGNSATVTVNILPASNAGDNVSITVCKLDGQVDLLNYLDSNADLGGTFTDLGNTNALNNSIVDLSMLTNGTYEFEYEVQPNALCSASTSILTMQVQDVSVPTVQDQSFCVGYGATINDIEISSSENTYNWYDNQNDTTTLDTNILLRDGEDYYVAAVNDNGCESERVKVTITLIEFGNEGCISCIGDGVSANNDSINDTLSLCDLPAIFPHFELKIFNRYGNTIYVGNIDTQPFDGTSNVDLTIGDQVPAGVYFYIFNPNDGTTKPFQGNFYLSR